jgi:hypothetical protein
MLNFNNNSSFNFLQISQTPSNFKNKLKINLSLFESNKNVHIEFNGNDTPLE